MRAGPFPARYNRPVLAPPPFRWILAAALGAVLCGLAGLATSYAAEPDAEAPAAADERPLPGPFHNIHVIDFEGDIEPLMLAYVRRRVAAAQEDGADCIVLRIDSPGGRVDSSKEIGDLLLGLPDSLHTVAWVPNKAISGAAFISLACRELLLTAHASIGDSQPILMGEGGKPEPVGEKLESPLRTWFTAYAERNGYPVLLAQAMVSAHMEVLQVRSKSDQTYHYVRGEDWRNADDASELIPGYPKSDLVQMGPAVVRKGELFTITGAQARGYGFVRRSFDGGLPRTEAEVMAALSAPDAAVTQARMSFSEKASKWLLAISGILSAFVVIAVALFMFQGPGLMTIVGGIALVLVVLINLTADQVHGFPIFLLLVGILLMAAEVFVLPGFGIAGFLGITSMAVGFLFLASGSTIGDTGAIDGDMLISFGLQFVATVIAGMVTLLVLSRFFPRIGPARRMILQTAGGPSGGVTHSEAAPEMPALGARGLATSSLRPAGNAEFEGRLVDVVSDGAFIHPGALVQVIQVEGMRVTVRPVEADPQSPDAAPPDAQGPA